MSAAPPVGRPGGDRPAADRLGGGRWRGRIPVPRRAHPLVRQLIREANHQMTTLTEIGDRAGLRPGTISEWRYRRQPRVDNLVAALNVLGLDLAVVEIDPEPDAGREAGR